ncbi:MAG: hypothetical protein ACXAD7_04915, partial [Candidatus Kariarchaeaceae archaeon]
MKFPPDVWVDRYQQILQSRETLWSALLEKKVDPKWTVTRVKGHQWSIDEILRHMLASEIRYLQQPIDPAIEQYQFAVRAQWVGKVFFRFEELNHVALEDLKMHFQPVQEKSQEIMQNLT